MKRALYLHGLASSPGSKKAAWLLPRLAHIGYRLEAPDLNVPRFEEMTITAQQEAVAQAVGESGDPVTLLGSSLGSLSALLYTSRRPERVARLILIAPALDFIATHLAGLVDSTTDEWRMRGYLEVLHYDDRLHRLGYQLVLDAAQYDFGSLVIRPPVTLIHGTADEVVPFAHSEAWVAEHPGARLVPIHGGDHSLLEHMNPLWSSLAETLY